MTRQFNRRDIAVSDAVLQSPQQPAGATLALAFPMADTTEGVDLTWRRDQFWLESTPPPASSRGAQPTRFTLTFRGNALADIPPRVTRVGSPLYHDHSIGALRRRPAMKSVNRFIGRFRFLLDLLTGHELTLTRRSGTLSRPTGEGRGEGRFMGAGVLGLGGYEAAVHGEQ